MHVVVCLIQDLMVDENIMKLEVKRLRDMLNERSDEVMSQEKRKLQLETVSKKNKKTPATSAHALFLVWAVNCCC